MNATGIRVSPGDRRLPTVVVAASDALSRSIAGADYRCTGSSDEDTIALAIADLATTGGIVQLSEGTFYIDMATQTTDSGVIHMPYNNVILQGVGRATNLRASTNHQGATDRMMIGVLGSASYALVGWGIRNLRITCRDEAEHGIWVMGSGGGTIEGVWLIHDGGIATSDDEAIQYWDEANGPSARGNQGDTLRHIYAEGWHKTGTGDAAIEFGTKETACRDINFSDAWLVSNGNGVKLREQGAGKVSRIHLSRIRVITPLFAGFVLNAFNDITLSQCEVFDGARSGFLFGGTTSAMNRAVLTGCVAEECNRRGFDIDGTGHKFIGCIAKNNGQDAAQTATNRAGFSLASGAVYGQLLGCESLDNQGTPTQQHGFIENSNPSPNTYAQCRATGNVTSNWSLGTGAIELDVVSVQLPVIDWTTALTTGDGKYYFRVDEKLRGHEIVRVHARVLTAGSGAGTTDIQIANVTQGFDVCSTKLTIDSTETGSDTAATAAVINTANDLLTLHDLIRIDIDAISAVAPSGLIVTIGARLA